MIFQNYANLPPIIPQAAPNYTPNLKLSKAQKLNNYSIGFNFKIAHILNSLKENPKNLFEKSMIINFHQKQYLYLRFVPKSLIRLREAFIRHNV